MPDDLESMFALPGWVKGLALSLAAIGAAVTGYASAGFPVPMTVEMHEAFHQREEVIESTRAALSFAQKVLDRQEPGSREFAEAEAYRDELQSRLDDLTE